MTKIIDIFNRKKIECYTSINEMPIENWFNYYETNDLKWLQKDIKQTANKYQKQVLQEAWNSVFDSYIDEFGVPDNIKKIVNLKREILINQIQIDVYGLKYLKTFIKIHELELKKLLEDSKEPIKTGKLKAFVDKNFGRQDPKLVTVKEFYHNLDLILQTQQKN